MTYDLDFTLPNAFLERILEHGLDVLPEQIRAVVNAAMDLVRQQHLGVAPYERSGLQRGTARMVAAKIRTMRLDRCTSKTNCSSLGGGRPLRESHQYEQSTARLCHTAYAG